MAYNVKHVGRFKTMTIGTPSITIRDVMVFEPVDKREVHYLTSAAHEYPRHALGNRESTLMVKTNDAAALTSLVQGLVIKDVSISGEATKVGDNSGAIGLQSAFQLTYTLSSALIEDITFKPESDGKAGELSIMLKAVVEDDGTEPVWTRELED